MYQDQGIDQSTSQASTIILTDDGSAENAKKLKAATSKKEKRYLFLLSIVSVVFWFAFTISIVGPVIFLFLIAISWFLNGLFVAYIRSESVKISKNQAPELYDTFVNVCKSLGLEKLPELYVSQAGGTLNAFVTKHSGRNFVVLYSDIVEAYGFNSPEVAFLIGHEVGHIRRKHLLKSLFLMPSRIIPLLSEAYDRACEATCDRFGAIASKNYDASKTALMILSGGKELGRKMNSDAFINQYKDERGFFVSCHELLSGYPTMSQRVFNIHEILNNREPKRSSRNILAYPISLVASFGRNFIAVYVVILLVAASGSAMKKQSFSSMIQSYMGIESEDLDSDESLTEQVDSEGDQENSQDSMQATGDELANYDDKSSSPVGTEADSDQIGSSSDKEIMALDNPDFKEEGLESETGKEQDNDGLETEVESDVSAKDFED